ncbi:DUF1311 domain-containing protein [bacterium]|nr:DUF1311 domain-containing protein [bacterium]
MKKIYSYFCLLVLLICTPFFALASEIDYMDLYEKCRNRCEYSTSVENTCNMSVCSEEIKDITDLKIKFLISKLENTIDDFKVETLRESQNAWQKYIETHCNLMGIYLGSPMFSYCPMTMSIDRINSLQMLMD